MRELIPRFGTPQYRHCMFVILRYHARDYGLRSPRERQLHLGAAVTTFKNVVDCVVTEYGVSELRGSSHRERTRKLVGIVHPKFRDELKRQAQEMSYL